MKSLIANTRKVLDKAENRRFNLLLVAGIAISIADIAFLALLLWIIRFYMQPGQSAVPAFFPAWMSDPHSVGMIGIFFILFALKNGIAWRVSRAQFDFTSRVAVRISAQNLSRFQRSDFGQFVETDSSALIRRIALQPFEFAQHVLSGLQQIITQWVLVSLAVIAILLFNAKLFLLLLLILLPPVALVFGYIKKRTGITKKNIRDSNEESYRYLLDALKGYVESNLNQRNSFFLERFVRQRRRFSGYLFESLLLQSLPGRIIELFAVLGLFILVLIAQWKGGGDSHTLITIGAFMAAAYKIIPGIVKLVNLYGQARAFSFSTEELMPPLTAEEPAGPGYIPIRSLAFNKVHFRYPQQTVLHQLSFSVRSGEMVGISGVSGKGKTTILNLLLGFLSPDSGEILVNDQSADSAGLQRYWPAIAYVRQQNFFIYDTILRNITLEEKEHDPGRLAFATRVTGLDNMAALFPEGLEKVITENGKNISGGQQQRIAMARAFYKNADLCLLDEPFNELDEASTFAILEELEQMTATGKMIILVTHDQRILSRCTKTVTLDEQG